MASLACPLLLSKNLRVTCPLVHIMVKESEPRLRAVSNSIFQRSPSLCKHQGFLPEEPS